MLDSGAHCPNIQFVNQEATFLSHNNTHNNHNTRRASDETADRQHNKRAIRTSSGKQSQRRLHQPRRATGLTEPLEDEDIGSSAISLTPPLCTSSSSCMAYPLPSGSGDDKLRCR